MFYRLLSVSLVVGFIAYSLTASAVAVSADQSSTVNAASYHPSFLLVSIENQWRDWVEGQTLRHPEIKAGLKRQEAMTAQAQGRGQPLYNPAVATAIEREGDDNNFRIGLSQTFDWQDKRGIDAEIGRIDKAQAQQAFELLWQQQVASALGALIERRAAFQLAQLARKEEAQLEALFQQVERRQQAGDLNALDAELAFMSLAQRLSHTAQALVALERATATLQERLPGWSGRQTKSFGPYFFQSRKNNLELASERPKPVNVPVPDFVTPVFQSLESAVGLKQVHLWGERNPLVASAKLQWQRAQQDAELMALNAQADPTFGLDVGESGGDGMVGLSLIMPLKIRNKNFFALESVRQRVASAEAMYQAAQRKQRISIEAAAAELMINYRYYQRWQRLMVGRDERVRSTLKKRWVSGDLNTTQYLVALQQQSEGLIAGIELERQYDLARVDWLLHTGAMAFGFNKPQ